MFTLGFCLCDRDFFGADCSLDLTQGSHVTALDDLGLCIDRFRPISSNTFFLPLLFRITYYKWQNKSYISKTNLIIGFCLCDRGFGGADCSLDLTQGPHVTALDNLGLCDVRTKPCRDVIVVAEQLATKAAEDELKCIIEIYKVSLWFLKLLQMILG